MPDYSTYTAGDFIVDPFFQRWVREPIAADEDFWQEWLEGHPERVEEVKLARQLILGLQVDQPLVSQEQIHQDVERMLGKIRNQPKPEWQIFRFLRSWQTAAAAVILLSGISWWARYPRVPLVSTASSVPVVQVDGNKTVYNATPRHIQFALPDDSQVTLMPKSTLTFPSKFRASSREVTLVGEAFFSIVHNPAKPFLVYADQIVTRVLGTSFRVRAYPAEKHLTVAVRTGKVAVYARKNSVTTGGKQVDKRIISLVPNQQVNFSRENSEFRKSLIANPVLIQPLASPTNFDFDETPVRDVLHQLEVAYGVNIIYDSDLLRDCALTASIAEESLSDKLTIICKGIGATYEVIDGTIIIHSKGCQ